MSTFIRSCILATLFLIPVKVVRAMDPIDMQLQCLAENISHEAPDESYLGKLAVATVTMNRVATKSFPKTVCGVVYQRSSKGCQFSWVCEKYRSIDSKVYEQALSIAKTVLYSGVRNKVIKNALYFHSISVHPSWSHDSDIKLITQIGEHIFYQ